MPPLWRTRTSEPYAAITGCANAFPIGNAHLRSLYQPPPRSNLWVPLAGPGGSGPAVRRIAGIVIAFVPVIDPLPYVASHVHYSVRACAAGITPHPTRVAHTVRVRKSGAQFTLRQSGTLFSPGVHTCVAAPPSCPFPLGLGRQPFACPGAITSSIGPRDEYDWVIVIFLVAKVVWPGVGPV